MLSLSLLLASQLDRLTGEVESLSKQLAQSHAQSFKLEAELVQSAFRNGVLEKQVREAIQMGEDARENAEERHQLAVQDGERQVRESYSGAGKEGVHLHSSHSHRHPHTHH